ncbi:regulator RcnB of Ni and Co efflux [Pseudomonas flavescens]|uniref:Regulator RcnB of Ni and Co efflux n=1 Tax=Phytopseudomonas flavescens TaxID=29435 RepID=A0A1G8M9X9_9GAMM|nr:anti-virulence regulator CigR family protein [Pseudomonas flavescens]SDI64779.1 regulator RcnB of Ni and Co efflux [Pseudomonas flavescens]
MPTRTPSALAFALFASLAAGLAQAAPGGEPRQEQPGHQQPGGKPQQQKQQQQPQAQNGQPGARQGSAAGPAAAGRQAHGQPPQDFTPVRQAFQQRRDQIGRGPAVPPDVRIVKGKPLPPGYGKRLDDRALRGLPHYQGYEWRRVGSDVVLVTLATGIVHAILSGVLD